MSRNTPLKADLSLVFIAFIWGTTFTVVKNAMEDIEPYAFLFLRFSLATLVILPLILKTGRFKTLPWKPGLLAGLFLFIGFAAQTIGLQYTTASKSGFITGLNVVFVPIFAAMFEKRLLRRNSVIAVILAVFGLYLLTNPQAQSFNRGDVWTILCAAGFALHIIALDWYSRKVDYVGLFFLQILTVAILSGIAFPFENKGFILIQHELTGNIIFAVVITAIFATAVAFFIQNWAQRITTGTRTALILTMEPVFAAVTAYFFLHERLGWMGLAGAGVILVAIIIAELRPSANV
jgi:drug/metabolite transporter (DMT)-like permease